MAQQLTKGMYEYHHNVPASDLFGLRYGQVRDDDFVHNGGWYNKASERIGWGDLSAQDFLNVSDGLAEGELFIILAESDDGRCFSTGEAPGVGYVAEHAMHIIAQHQFYAVNYGHLKGDVVNIKGLAFQVLTREAARQLIAS